MFGYSFEQFVQVKLLNLCRVQTILQIGVAMYPIITLRTEIKMSFNHLIHKMYHTVSAVRNLAGVPNYHFFKIFLVEQIM